MRQEEIDVYLIDDDDDIMMIIFQKIGFQTTISRPQNSLLASLVEMQTFKTMNTLHVRCKYSSLDLSKIPTFRITSLLTDFGLPFRRSTL
jgi:hypothetical protein